MFWIMMTILGILAIIAGIIWYKLDNWSDGGPILTIVGIVVAFIFGVMTIGQIFYEKDIVTEYEMLSEYTENYNYNNEAEKIIIDSKKHAFNIELIDNKASAKNRSFFWINPEKIEQLNYLQ